MDNHFEKACQHFDGGEYFEAHEEWEELWNLADGERHNFLQGLIQIAAALHHAQKGNFKGTEKLFASGLNYLEKGQRCAEQVDFPALKDRILDFHNAVKAGEKELPYFKLPMRP